MINPKIILSIFCISIFFACNLEQMENLDKENEVIKEESAFKDSTINEMLGAFNKIQANLNEIKEREGVIQINSEDNTKDLEQSITDDIRTINSLMQENEKLIEQLENKLANSNSKNQEFRKMIANLNKQIEYKNQEIAQLNTQLQAKNEEIGVLYFSIDSLNATTQLKDKVIKEKVEELNTAYYAYGTYKELEERKVLTKEGGFLGIGKSENLKDNFNKDYFSKINIQEQRSFLIYSDKAELVTTHPKNSYEFRGKDDKVDSLVILKPEEFWSASKYMVVVID